MNEKFKELYKKQNISMYALAAKTGLPYTTINNLFNDKLDINHVAVEAVYKIAIVLQCEIKDIMNPVQIMNNAKGCYRKIRYQWVCKQGENAEIQLQHNGNKVLINMDNTFNKESSRQYYDYFAEMAIDRYLERLKFEKTAAEYEKKLTTTTL